MVLAMLLAHLVGDYILQWDSLARWKSQSVKGAIAHGFVVLVVTVLFALPFDVSWWYWALFIGITHILVDAGQQWLKQLQPHYKPMLPPLARFLIDQGIHISIILIVLAQTGCLNEELPWWGLPTEWDKYRPLAIVLGYVFLMMPAWVLIEFTVHGLISGCAPNFSNNQHKYTSILERILITTFVILGQFLLVPLVTLPRLMLDMPNAGTEHNRLNPLYLAELLASVTLAVLVGLLLRPLFF